MVEGASWWAVRVEGRGAGGEACGAEEAVDGGEVASDAGEKLAEMGRAGAADLDLAAGLESQDAAARQAVPDGIQDSSELLDCDGRCGVLAPVDDVLDFDTDRVRRPRLEADRGNVGLGVLLRDRFRLHEKARTNVQAHAHAP
jgi:hypothetical protein